jgi:hypothetical protein
MVASFDTVGRYSADDNAIRLVSQGFLDWAATAATHRSRLAVMNPLIW